MARHIGWGIVVPSTEALVSQAAHSTAYPTHRDFSSMLFKTRWHEKFALL